MWGCVYGEHKIHKFYRNHPVVIEIQGVENGELTVPVNNTLVHHMTFMAANMTMYLDGGHKICISDRDWPSSYRDTSG